MGEQREEVCFIDIEVWGKQAESCNTYLKKGSQALVEGRLRFDQWASCPGIDVERRGLGEQRAVLWWLERPGRSSACYHETSKLGQELI